MSHPQSQGEPPLISFRPVVDPAPLPRSNRLVITVATGNAQKILAETAGAMKSYATFCGADFIALTNQTQDWPMAEKFRIHHFAQYYKRVLFVDADVFIRKASTDIFDAVPPGYIAMHDDTPGLLRSSFGLDWMRLELEKICQSQQWDVPVAAFCLNSGVVVFDRQDAGIWSPPLLPFPAYHCAEQDIVQIRSAATDRVFALHERWNWQWWSNLDFAGIENANFIHLAGMSQFQPSMQVPLLRAMALKP